MDLQFYFHAPRPFQDLLLICREMQNIIPLMADATKPGSYASFVEIVDPPIRMLHIRNRQKSHSGIGYFFDLVDYLFQC
ncbi:MAG: hypothetical protein LUP99_00455 [Methanomicrobiales archaeon]|nr:hypothetical protein [Methanomicrobiales archaeon]